MLNGSTRRSRRLRQYALTIALAGTGFCAHAADIRVSAAAAAFSDSLGQRWEARSGFNGGWQGASCVGDIANTGNDAPYRANLVDAKGWSRALPNGNYRVTLALCEPYFNAAGQRVFSVWAEGVNRLSHLDIFQTVGKNAALNRSFVVQVKDGQLNLGFVASKNFPLISGITVAAVATPAGLYPIFSKPGNIWTTRLPANAPIASNSADVVARLVRQSRYGDSINGAAPRARYNGHWYHYIGTDWQRIWPNIPATTATKRVLWIDGNGNPVDAHSANTGFPLQSWIDAVPVPDMPLEQLRSHGGGDKPLVLYQKSSDTVWEFWQIENNRIARRSDGKNYYTAPNGTVTRADYTTRYAGRIKPASESSGVYPLTTGSSATSLPYVNSFIMIRDGIAGKIEHALTLTLPVTGTTTSAPCTFVAPATRCDSFSFLANGPDMRAADGIKEGTLFRLPASFNVEAHAPGNDERSRFLRMVLTAIRDYGVYLTDTSPTLSINAEGDAVARLNTQYHDLRGDQVPAWWGKQGIFWGENNITSDIPWHKMQVVQAHTWRNWQQ